MPLAYTTEEAIMRRLQGRLDLYGATALGRTSIDPELLRQVAVQAEARLTSVLRQQYTLPLRTEQPIAAEYVEQRCVCAIIPIHFQRQNVSDDRGLAEVACREADKLLEKLATGEILLHGELAAKEPDNRRDAPTLAMNRKPGAAEGITF